MRTHQLLACTAALWATFLPSELVAQWQPSAATTGPIYYNGGNVGIGTTAPAYQLDVSSGGNALMRLNAGNASRLIFASASNTFGIGNNYYMGGTFGIRNETTNNDVLTIRNDGNVGIGTTSPCSTGAPTGCKLSVNGAIQAKEVVVNTGWSDYVFDPQYRLRPLSEVSAFVAEHKHLPGIPSEQEVQEKGVSVGEMQAKLLAKIEELTLHMIEADKRIRRLEQENQELRHSDERKAARH